MSIRNLTLLAIFLSVSQFVSATGDGPAEADPALVTFVNRAEKPWHAQTQQWMRQLSAWQNFEQTNGNWWVEFNEQTGLPHYATGPAITINKMDDWEAMARNFLGSTLSAYEIPVNQLEFNAMVETREHRIVKFRQKVQEIPVLWSNVWVRFTAAGKVMAFGTDAYPNVKLGNLPPASESQISQWAQAGIPYNITNVEVEDGLSILPIQRGESGLQYRQVYTVYVDATMFDGEYARYFTLVDGETGEVYYRINTIHNCAPAGGSVSVDGDVTDNPLQSVINRGLPYMRVRINGTDYYTDSLGQLDLPNLTNPTQATFYLEGKYAHVFNASNNDKTPSFTTTLNPGVNTITFNNDANASEIAGYFHTNTIYWHMKHHTPAGFTGMDTVMNVYVEVNVSSCNAYYDGDINFYAAGNGCPSTVQINDVVYHEFGHGINEHFYDYLGGNFNNGALHEGYADVWALTLTKEPVLGKGFEGAANTFVRRYDTGRKVYPKDIVGESHADGEIIAGAWWDTYLNLNQDMEYTIDLFVNSQLNTPMAPDGAEGQLFTDILLEALLYDDDDNNLFNGTPNSTAIIDAFALHGITLIADVEVNHQDEPGMEAANVPVDITSNVTVSLPQFLGDVFINYRTTRTGTYTQLQMTKGAGPQYSAQIPAQQEGTIIDYYFEVKDIFNNPANITPLRADEAIPNLPYYRMVGFENIIEEDFDNDWGGWSVDPDGTDDASTGMWDFLSPEPTYSTGVLVQTGVDHTTKGAQTNLCAVTGNAPSSSGVGTNDVDDGRTTLQSPVFDLTNYEKPAITYWRWFNNDPPTGANPANDFWKVYISNNGTDWVRVEYSNVSDVSWRRKAILVEDYVAPTSTVMVRFIASDSLIPGANLDGGSIVEAAVDDLFILDLGTHTGVVDPQATHFNVYPNPATDKLVVNWSADELEVQDLQLTDLAGRTVRSWPAQAGSDMGLSLEGLADGIYFLRIIEADGRTLTRKIVKAAR